MKTPYREDRRGSRGKGGEGSARSSNGYRVMWLREAYVKDSLKDGLSPSTERHSRVSRGFCNQIAKTVGSKEEVMGDWDDAEIRKFNARGKMMVVAGRYTDDSGAVRDGITFEEAERTAQQLLYRDRDPSDDRRVCFECKWLDGRRCKALRLEPVRIVLQRCDRFELKVVKK